MGDEGLGIENEGVKVEFYSFLSQPHGVHRAQGTTSPFLDDRVGEDDLEMAPSLKMVALSVKGHV